MEFAIKIGEKYFKEAVAEDSKGGYNGHSTSTNIVAEGIRLQDMPKYMDHRTVTSKIATIIELMRWQDIEVSEITIVPKDLGYYKYNEDYENLLRGD